MQATPSLLLVILSVAFLTSNVRAGTVMNREPLVAQTAINSPFDKGSIELQAMPGAFFSMSSNPPEEPTLNHTLSSWRFGVMLNDVSGSGLFRGNTEFLLEGFFGKVFEGPGDYLGGGMIQLRYNFVQADTRWVPYAQIGAGGFFSDIYKDQSQSLIGESLELTLQAALGIRYLLNDRWAISLEGGYRHVTNAGASDRDKGLNELGVQLGLCHFF
jgi:hypothetical protein